MSLIGAEVTTNVTALVHQTESRLDRQHILYTLLYSTQSITEKVIPNLASFERSELHATSAELIPSDFLSLCTLNIVLGGEGRRLYPRCILYGFTDLKSQP